jgi:hypothetical protein
VVIEGARGGALKHATNTPRAHAHMPTFLTDDVLDYAVTNITLDPALATLNSFGLTATVASGLTQYRNYSLRGNNNLGHFVAIGAEL